MTAFMVAVQLLLPLALLLWFVLQPARSIVGFVLQAAGVGAFLFALARVALWAVPVWWLPSVYGAVWLGAIVTHAMRGVVRGRPSMTPLLPVGAGAHAAAALALLLLGIGGWYGAQAVAARSLPSGEVVDIANPLGPGRYLVAHGGSSTLLNRHLNTLDVAVPRYLPWRGQSRAIDVVGLGPFGLRARGWQPTDPSAYAIFGASLHAPCDGIVVAAESGRPDFDVPQLDTVDRLGNHVILRCGDAQIVLAHMRRGSVTVVPGARVATGDALGEVGNSGASSEPHLHIHAQRPAAPGAPPISGEPLALRIDGRFLVRGDRLEGQDW